MVLYLLDENGYVTFPDGKNVSANYGKGGARAIVLAKTKTSNPSR